MNSTSKLIYYIITILFLSILGIILYSTYKETMAFDTCELGDYPEIYEEDENNYAPADAPFKYVYNIPTGSQRPPIGTQMPTFTPTPTGTQMPTFTPTPTVSSAATFTPTPTVSSAATFTPTPTVSSAATFTPTPAVSSAATFTPTPAVSSAATIN